MGKGKNGWEQATTGLIIALVFGTLWVRGGSWIWIFPAVFGGLMPMMDGLRKVIAGRADRREAIEAHRRRPEDLEREVLRVARNQGGVLTPSLTALESGLSVAEAETVLESLASRGHCSIEVRAEGRIVYEFHEFMRPLGPPGGPPGAAP